MTREKRQDPNPQSEWAQIDTPYGAFAEQARRSLVPLAPAAAIDMLHERGFSNDEIHELVAPRRTLARRIQKGEHLTIAETDRVRRLERIVDMADRVFGRREKAHRWLRSRIIALGGSRPIDFLVSESGAREIEDEIGRIDHGMVA